MAKEESRLFLPERACPAAQIRPVPIRKVTPEPK